MGSGWIGLVAFVITSLIGVITYGVRKIVSGDLVPRTTLTDQKVYYDERLAREKEISTLLQLDRGNLTAALEKQGVQLSTLVQDGQTTREVMNALRAASDLASKGIKPGGVL